MVIINYLISGIESTQNQQRNNNCKIHTQKGTHKEIEETRTSSSIEVYLIYQFNQHLQS